MDNQPTLFNSTPGETRDEDEAGKVIVPFCPLYSLRLVHVGELSIKRRVQVRSPEDVAALFFEYFHDKPTEEFLTVLLNTANVVTGVVQISQGGLAASIVEPRAVFAAAIDGNAAAVIGVHNHPSLSVEPSREDIRVTRQLVEAGKIMGIPVHDHIIMGGRTYTSLAERGLLG